MQRITSFEVNHHFIVPGIYISRIDGDVTTYDLRTRTPNAGSYMDHSTMHTTEHLFATYIRNGALKDQILYFGPMGCQTGFYLLVRNSVHSEVLAEIKAVLQKIIDHQGEVFGSSAVECGNYKSLNLAAAQAECTAYLAAIARWTEADLQYPTGKKEEQA